MLKHHGHAFEGIPKHNPESEDGSLDRDKTSRMMNINENEHQESRASSKMRGGNGSNRGLPRKDSITSGRVAPRKDSLGMAGDGSSRLI